MKRILILFSLILLVRIYSFSQSISNQINQDSILISTEQLKYTNLIFVEHKKLLKENELLTQQVSNYQYLNKTLVEVDSLRLDQIRITNDYWSSELKKQNKVLKSWKIGSITVSISLLLFLLFK